MTPRRGPGRRGGLVGRLRPARLRSRPAARVGPAVSVVVVVTDDNAVFLDECMTSLRSQRDGDEQPVDEVLLVQVRPNDRTRMAVGLHEAASPAHPPVTTVPAGSLGHAAALHTGVEAATGELVLLCDAGDLFAPGAVAVRLQHAREGADVVGGTRDDLGRVRLHDLLFRRDLWPATGLGTVDVGARDRPVPPYQDWWLAARLVLAADSAVAAPGARTHAERRGSGTAFGSMPVLTPHVPGWSAAVQEILDRVGLGASRESFLRWLLDEEDVAYLEDAERCSPDGWEQLVAVVGAHVASAPASLVADLRVESRARLWLATQDRRAELERYNAARWLEDGQLPTTLEGERVVASLPDLSSVPPEEVRVVGPTESRLVTVLRGMRRVDGGALELQLFCFVATLASDAAPGALSVWLSRPDGSRVPLRVERRPDPEVNLLAGEPFADHRAGAFRAVLDGPVPFGDAVPGDRYRLEAELSIGGLTRNGGLTDVELRGSAGALPSEPGGLTLRPRRSGAGGWDLVVASEERKREGPDAGPDDRREQTAWLGDDVTLTADALVVGGSAGVEVGVGKVGVGTSFDLRGPHRSDVAVPEVAGGRFLVQIPLAHDPWGLGRGPLPPGTYRVHSSAEGHDPVRLRASPGLVARTPYRLRSENHRAHVQRGLDGALLVTLAAPLREDEVGAHAQERLRRWYVEDRHPVDPGAVLLQSYTGQSATDSPLAIHHALRRHRPDLRLRWAVADRSTSVPEGAEPVLVRSREWYAALAASGAIVTNVDLDRWFTKRPGQRVLQTYHGYPAKTMGIAAWEAKRFTPLRIQRQLRRTSGTWDLLLTPTPEMDVHYRREYRYHGEILAAGYPRDDALVGPEAERLREETRSRLGITAGKRAVLYAPTWRDDLATNFRSAAMTTAFDVERAAEELGEDHVLLLRGHRFHRRRGPAGARLLDVTGYPEVNHLILAADAAVLDYSSMRFDVALTGRPMVFLVPDLDRYTGGVRGFLFDFRDSAPGPLVSTTEEVVAELRDLDGLLRRHEADLARFNAMYNAHQDGCAADRVVDAFFAPRRV